MAIDLTCYHCNHLDVAFAYYDEDNNEVKSYECELEHPDIDEDSDICEDFVPCSMTNNLYVRGIIDMPLETWLEKSKPCYHLALLRRLKHDCMEYLTTKKRDSSHFWADTKEEQIKAMETIWNRLPVKEKPDWLTIDDIVTFKVALGV